MPSGVGLPVCNVGKAELQFLHVQVGASRMKTVSVLMLLFGASPRGEVIELTMDNCFYCDQVEPTVLRLKREGLPIRQIHAQRQPEEARRFGCDRFPTFLLLVDDKVV